ncbi:MAG: hypothetical protein AAGH45_10350 [Pseudomonadota bacterium]
MLREYFGIIEGAMVFTLAVGFYIWQMRTLKRDIAARKAREAAEEADARPGSVSDPAPLGETGKPAQTDTQQV